MKKMFFMAAIAGVALASCAKNEVETPEQDIITFAEPVTAVQTKATEIVGNYPTSENFSVFAHYFTEDYTTLSDGLPYMWNVETAYNDGLNGWDSKAVADGVNYYWPKQGTLTFAAYSPSRADDTDMVVEYSDRGIQFKNFCVKHAPTAQYDLLFSERAYNQTKADMTTHADHYWGVQLKFNHALSSILFTVRTDKDYAADNFKINVTKIELKNVKWQGNFDQGLVDGNGRVTRANTEWPGWTVDNNTTVDYIAFEGDQLLNTTETRTKNITNANNSNLILLPQYLSHDVMLYVEYTIYNNNTGISIPQNAELSIREYGNVQQWYRGNRYIYNITIGLDKIYFDPTVTEWVEIGAGNVTIGNTAQPAN